ncbi:hypothetical protein ACIP02_17915 [Pseudomonas sp. NPDC089408]|uniref:hypothetical protein n=1 Tax=Pseudomonas sp. NPDC089408 TaxID=3364465 RepID=UPI003830AE2B
MKNDPIVVEIDFTAIDVLFADADSSAAEQKCKLITYQDSKTGVILDYSLEPRSPDDLSETNEDGQLPK